MHDVWFFINLGIIVDRDLFYKKLKEIKLDIRNIVSKQKYENDLKYLVSRVFPYDQIKREIVGV